MQLLAAFFVKIQHSLRRKIDALLPVYNYFWKAN